MKNTQQTPPKPTAMMRIGHVKINHVVPAHILAGINAGYDKTISKCPVVGLKVLFHESGEAYSVGFRLNGYTLGGSGEGGFAPGPFMRFSPEVVAYLSHVADQALAMVQPIVTTH